MTFEEALETELERAMEDVNTDFGDRVRNHIDLLFGSRKNPRVFRGLEAFLGPA